MNHRRLKDSIDPIMIKATLAFLLSRQNLPYAAESRVIFWNLLFTMVLSSLLLLTYLKKILFDF